MASGRFLLDTNIIIALLNGDDAVISNLDEASEVFIPAVALGELFFGAARSSRPSENIDRVERFASGRAIVLCDLDVAREYGLLKQRLKEKGRPLSENDIWIAAAAKRYGLTLVTRDSHFRKLKTCSAWIGPFIRKAAIPIFSVRRKVGAHSPGHA